MKNRIWSTVLAAAVLATLLVSTPALAARVYVSIAPPPLVVETVPVAPSPAHVWVAGYHSWNGKAYVWMPGHYVVPPRPHAVWVAGHWAHHHTNGWYWNAGHWR